MRRLLCWLRLHDWRFCAMRSGYPGDPSRTVLCWECRWCRRHHDQPTRGMFD